MKIDIWVCRDKSGSTHISNVKPYIPKGNNEIYTIDPGYLRNGLPKWFLLTFEEFPGLTFEDGPQRLDFIPNQK